MAEELFAFAQDEEVKACTELSWKILVVDDDKQLIDIYSSNVSIAFENLYLDKEVLDTQNEVIETHAEIGHSILKNSKRPILKAAAIIAYEHHEKYDGSGYPRGLKEHEIHIYGRILAIADIFDALTQRRYCKNSWTLEESIEYMKKNKGSHFDPNLIDIFFST